ncbi:hypothetical protein FQA39_LY09210 [Lamprigera yunnana]|nr:hypothetical protein FQA39_LY09210 [Lamprigera yunnana]
MQTCDSSYPSMMQPFASWCVDAYIARYNLMIHDSKIIENVKDRMWKNEQTFKTVSGVQKCCDKIKMPMRIDKMKEDVDVYVIKNDNSLYDILLGLDAIQQFCLMQDNYLNIFQWVNDDGIEHIEKLKDASIRLENIKQNDPRKLDSLIGNNIGLLNYIGKTF